MYAERHGIQRIEVYGTAAPSSWMKRHLLQVVCFPIELRQLIREALLHC